MTEDVVSREHLLSGIDELMKSPWFNNGKDDRAIPHYGYVERKEAVEVVRDLCIKAEQPVTPKPGKWVEGYNETLNERVLYCDKCYDYVPRGTNYDYCPHCGAKMEGVIDKETMDDLERYFFGDDRDSLTQEEIENLQ